MATHSVTNRNLSLNLSIYVPSYLPICLSIYLSVPSPTAEGRCSELDDARESADDNATLMLLRLVTQTEASLLHFL